MQSEKLIYLVDDDEDDRMIIGRAVRQVMHNAKIIEFSSGIDFLKFFLAQNQQAQTLILMDINMPLMSGIEVITALKSDPFCQHYPVVAISTATDRAYIDKVIAIGAVKYHIKPDSLEKIGLLAESIKDFYHEHYNVS